MTDDPFDLQRFVSAQAGSYETALQELRSGRKRSHWMWFVFPQLRGLGLSATAQFYGIGSLAEARAYREHPLLGPRLVETTLAMLQHQGSSAHAILGSPDDLKFRSSTTLFARVDPAGPFRAALDAFYRGEEDPATLRLLEGS
jgi:uncharacterized protein (DUF1810 family)